MDDFIGGSVAMHCVRVAAERFAMSDVTLVLIGETGTGKSRLARLVTAAGPLAAKPWVPIDGAAMDAGLLPTDMEYAWVAAAGGTLFIDHIGETPLALQVHLAKLLRQKTAGTGPRLIVAHQRPLEGAVAAETFDAGLFEQLHSAAIHLPALRHRPEDIPDLAVDFLRHVPRGRRPYELSAGAVVRLQGHRWPGNVRELHNVLRRAMVLAGTRMRLQARDMVFDARGFALGSAAPRGGGSHSNRLRSTAPHAALEVNM